MRTDEPVHALVTGGAGFIGSNVADRLAEAGHAVTILDSLERAGSRRNLAWLQGRHGDRITHLEADIRDRAAVDAAVERAGVVFHFAAQVAVTTSMTDPIADFSVNLAGTVGLLEALRRCAKPAPLLFASTNKVYGDLGEMALRRTNDAYLPEDETARRGVDEDRPLDFHTPYGCSKGAADQYVLDYARSFGLPTAVMRMSCIYGQRQMGTEDQGWVAHFAIRALEGGAISIFGDGCQVCDVLDIGDAVAAYLAAWRNIDRIRGRVFNLGGGPENAVSLRQLVRYLEILLDRPVAVEYADWRAGDQRYYVSDPRAVRAALDLRPFGSWKKGVANLVRWLASERGMPMPMSVAEGSLAPS